MVRKDITLDERAEIMDLGITAMSSKPFSAWVKIIRIGTDLTDEDIMKLTNDEIVSTGTKVVESFNKKK